jgi:peroxiredoxin
MSAKLIVGIVALAAAVAWTAAIVGISKRTLFRPAPEVRFAPLSGETFSTSDLRGKVVLVNFWGSYCGPCIKEMPKIVETYHKFAPRGYETIAVAVRRDSPERVEQFAASRALPFKVALDRSGDLAREFGNVRVTPTSFLIDRKGRVLRRYVGEHDWAGLHRLVERELAR